MARPGFAEQVLYTMHYVTDVFVVCIASLFVVFCFVLLHQVLFREVNQPIKQHLTTIRRATWPSVLEKRQLGLRTSASASEPT